MDAVTEAQQALDRVRALHHEDPDGALAEAVRCHELGRNLGDPVLRCRALAVQAAVALQRGDLRGAVALTAGAEAEAERAGDAARAELTAIKGQISFFAGSYPESLRYAERAIELADRYGDLSLRLFTRRCACVVFGNVGVSDWHARLHEVLELAIEAGDGWEEAISRNDVAHLTMEQGDLAGAERELERAERIAAGLEHNRFLTAVLKTTRADVRLRDGRAAEGLADSREAMDLLLAASGNPNPYLLAMIVVVEVQALLALERLDEAERTGQRMVERLGERVPQARSLILSTVAAALREAGRAEEAYDVLLRTVEVERRAFQELFEIQRGLDLLAAKNRELEQLVERDPLTGLHNRRFLAREMDRHAGANGPFSVAVLDLDHFKSVNDRFGHQGGDQVLMRVASLLLGQMRGQDMVVRAGGEEFVLVMPRTGARAAVTVCERLREAIREEPWEHIAPGLRLTTSIGVATADDADDLDGLTELADRRLYEAKRSGRDRVVA